MVNLKKRTDTFCRTLPYLNAAVRDPSVTRLSQWHFRLFAEVGRHFLGANTVNIDRGCGTDRKRLLIRHVDAKDTHGENSVKTSRTTQEEDVAMNGR